MPSRDTLPLDTHYLRRRIERRGVKQWWLARELGVDRKTVSRWVTGKVKRVDPENAAGLARLLDCALEDLVAGDGEVSATPEDQRRAAELLEREDLIRFLSPSDNWELAESLIRSSMVPGLPLQRLGRLYNLLSMAVWRQGRYTQAAELAGRALEMAKRIGDRAMEHKALFNLATIDSITGRLQSARDVLWTCLEHPEHFGDDRDIGLALANFASTCLDLGDFDNSLPYQHEALKIFEQLKLPYNQAIAWLNIGIEHAELGRLKEAEHACLESVRCADAASYPRGRLTALAYLAGLYALRGNLDSATVTMSEALAGLREFDIYATAVHEVEARVARLAADYDKAGEVIARTLPRMKNFPVQLASLHLETARLVLAVGDEAGEERERGLANEVYERAGIPRRIRTTRVVEYGLMFEGAY